MFTTDLVARALAEWEYFGRDEGTNDKSAVDDVDHEQKPKEQASPFHDRVANYWLSISEKDYKRLLKLYKPPSGRLDGRLKGPWSAAFISYCMQMAGAGTEFPYSPGHATWIVASIKNRDANKVNAALVGYRPGESVVALGDLVGAPRGDYADTVTYDNAVTTGWFESHTDIVVEVDTAKREFYTIGGNVGQSVSRKTFPLKASGEIASGSGLKFHIVNNITGKIAAASANAAAVNIG